MDPIATDRTVWCGKLAGMMCIWRRSSHPTSRSSLRSLLTTASIVRMSLLAHILTVAVPSTAIGAPEAFMREGHFSLLIEMLFCCATRYARRDTVAPVSGVARI